MLTNIIIGNGCLKHSFFRILSPTINISKYFKRIRILERKRKINPRNHLYFKAVCIFNNFQ